MLFQQLNTSQSQDEQINIQDSIHYLMVLLAWSVVALFSNSQYSFTHSQYSFTPSQYPFVHSRYSFVHSQDLSVHSQYLSLHSQYSQYYLLVFLSLIEKSEFLKREKNNMNREEDNLTIYMNLVDMFKGTPMQI